MHVHVLHLVPFVFCRNLVVEMFFHAFDSYMVWDFVELPLIFLPFSLSLLHSFPPSCLLTLSLSSVLLCHIVFINTIIFLCFLLYLYSL